MPVLLTGMLAENWRPPYEFKRNGEIIFLEPKSFLIARVAVLRIQPSRLLWLCAGPVVTILGSVSLLLRP